MFSALWISTLAVAVAEIGDKTQLLSLMLAARYRRPWPIVAGILVATVLNHAAAGWLGSWVSSFASAQVLRWCVAISFFAVAAWALVPDKVDDDEAKRGQGLGAFAATVVAFFIAEMGDKTQIATVVLAAQYSPLWQVVAGTTLGMLAANVPVIVLGAKLAERIPMRAARIAAAVLFALLGIWVIASPYFQTA